MDNNKGTTPNEEEFLSSDSLQNSNSNTISLNNIYPDSNQNKPTLDENTPQSHLKADNNKIGLNTQVDNSKKLFLMVLIGMAVLIGVGAVLFVPKLFESNRKEIQKNLESIDYILPSTIGACKEVRDYVEDYIDVGTYEAKVDACRRSVDKLYELVNELDFADNTEEREAFDSFRISLDTNMPNPNQLENTLEVYTAMHNLNVALHNYIFDGKSPDYKTELGEELVNAANYFSNSSDEKLSQYGNEIKQTYSELNDTWQQFRNEINEMGENNPANHDKYVTAEKNFMNCVDNKPNLPSLYLLANDDDGEISEAFSNLMKKVKKD